MPDKKRKNEDYWRLAEETTEQIKKWPEWKRNISMLDEKDVDKVNEANEVKG